MIMIKTEKVKKKKEGKFAVVGLIDWTGEGPASGVRPFGAAPILPARDRKREGG